MAETDRDGRKEQLWKASTGQSAIDQHGAGRRCLPQPGVAAVTGCDKAVGVCRDASTLSSCNSVGGPYPPLRVQPGSDDVSDVIEVHRDQWPMSEFMVTMDGSAHETQHSLLRHLLTPYRIKENEAALAGPLVCAQGREPSVSPPARCMGVVEMPEGVATPGISHPAAS
jgi:hypothetical protein